MNSVLSLIVALITITAVDCSNDERWSVYYVKPSEAEQCSLHRQPCHTLQYYVNNSNFSSNSTFLLLKGVHTLHSIAEIRNVTNLALIGVGSEDSKVQCEGPAGLFFRQMIHGNLTISNLTFSNCGAESADGLPCGALVLDTVVDLNLTNVIVENTTGYGLLGFNLLGNSFVTNSVFRYNIGTQDCIGANTWIYYGNCPKLDTPTLLTISSSQFLFGKQFHVQLLSLGSGGLNFVMNCTNVSVHATNLTLYGNEGYFGGNLYLYFLLFTNISVTLQNSSLTAGCSSRGAGALVIIDQDVAVNDKYSCGDHSVLNQKHHQLIYLSNVTFDGNSAEHSGGGLQIEDRTTPGYLCAIQLVVIENSVFTNNTLTASWLNGQAVRLSTFAYTVQIYDVQTKRNIQTEFRNTKFKNHEISNSIGYAVVKIESYVNVTFSNCIFMNNKATAIRALQTNVIFEGNNTFLNNTGGSGAGLALFMNSYMYLKPHTNLLFVNNHALSVGGAIYTDLTLVEPRLTLPCFFQVLTEGQEEALVMSTISVEFVNNTAGVAGSSLYGGYIEGCKAFNRLPTGGVTAFKSMFHYNSDDSSVISSDPVGVCFCSLTDTNTLQPNCQRKNYPIKIYPGELFRIPMVLIGQINGTVPGVVHSSFRHGGNTASLGDLQESQIINVDCTLLNYSIFSTRSSVILTLFPRLEFHDYEAAQLVVSFHQCPPAFVISTVSRGCDCTPILARHHAKCYIDNQTILRPPMTWIGYYHNNSTDSTANQSGVLLHQHCPFDYCHSDWSYLTINNTDTQCVFNHSGILCGGCKPGLSLTLGRPLCQHCSDRYIALLAAFAGAGVALVILLITCNVTATEGTVNGLIFYANIVRVNHTTFFPPYNSNILTIFIAWINLDLGIQSCFYDGMDGYTVTWLQFVFPVYIWTIIIFIILLSRRYHIATRLIGKNAVKVLATLLLLSYTKLLRTIITVLSFTYIIYPDNSTKYLWLYDGNIDYLKGKHIYLFAVAAVFLLFLVLPYTLVLVFVQSLQANSGWKVFSWVNKLKPLFDAYTGPYQDKHRFWTGFLLLVRNVLLLVFAFNTLGDPSLNLLVITLASLSLTVLFGVFHPVYKKGYCNILEFSFYLNLGAVSVATLYACATNGNQAAVIYTSTSIAFFTFAGTVLFHVYHRANCHHRVSTMWQRVSTCCFLQCKQQEDIRAASGEPLLQVPESECEESSDQGEVAQPLPPVIHYDQYREPLLEYEDI